MQLFKKTQKLSQGLLSHTVKYDMLNLDNRSRKPVIQKYYLGGN
jgi:hypothetical protein